MLAIEFVSDKETKAPLKTRIPPATIVANKCLEHGLLVRSLGDAIVIAPSLVYTTENFLELFSKLNMAIKDFDKIVYEELPSLPK